MSLKFYKLNSAKNSEKTLLKKGFIMWKMESRNSLRNTDIYNLHNSLKRQEATIGRGFNIHLLPETEKMKRMAENQHLKR